MKAYSFITSSLFLVAALAAPAKDLAKIKADFESVGTNGAAGSFQMLVGKDKARVAIKASGLKTNTTHQLLIGGVPEAGFNSGSKGKGKLKLLSTSTNVNQTLDLDPRGKLVSISDGSTNVLVLGVATTNEPASIGFVELAGLNRTTNAPSGSAEVSYRERNSESSFEVDLSDVPAGEYEVFVAGILRGTNNVGSNGSGTLEFGNDASGTKLPLDFDPRGQTVDILKAGAVWFTGVFRAAAAGLTTCTFSLTEAPLLSTGTDADASGNVRFITQTDCRRDLNVEVEDLPVGNYELLVGGVVRGTIEVGTANPGTEGELEFTTEVDDAYKLLLDFDPAGHLIEVRQGATIYFSDIGAANTPASNVCTAVTIEVPLFNAGVIPGGKSEARFRFRDDCEQDFRVEIEDLPEDAYNLHVDGVKVGTINSANVGGENRGRIEFDTNPDDPNEIPLTFDPRGKLVEVLKGSETILSRVFPAN